MKVDEEDNMKRIIRWKNYNSVPGDFVIATSMQHWISDLEEAKTNYLIPYGEGEFDNNNWMAYDFDRQTQYEKETKMDPILYVDVMINRRKEFGLFEVLHLSDCFLVKDSVLKDQEWIPEKKKMSISMQDSWFSLQMRKRGITPRILNFKTYGQIVNVVSKPEINEQLTLYPELSRFFENLDLWQRRYINSEVIESMGKGNPYLVKKGPRDPETLINETECKDVFYIKLFSHQFVDELLAEVKLHENLFEQSTKHTPLFKEPQKPMELFQLFQMNLEKELVAIKAMYINYILGTTFLRVIDQRDGMFLISKEHTNPETVYIDKEEYSYFYKASLPLNQEYEGGETKFVQRNCPSIPDPPEKGQLILYPHRFINLGQMQPITSGTRYMLTYFSTIHLSLPFGINGYYHLPGHVEAPVYDSNKETIVQWLVSLGYLSQEQAMSKNLKIILHDINSN